MVEIDRTKEISAIYGVPGVKWKQGEHRFNARGEEMEFVSNGTDDDDGPIYRPKQMPVPELKPEPEREPEQPRIIEKVEEPAVEEPVYEEIPFDWNMKKNDVIKALNELGVIFDPRINRSKLISLLREEQKKSTSDLPEKEFVGLTAKGL